MGNNGLTVALTLPSKKMVIVKTICDVEHSESTIILKPLLALHTVNGHKHEINGNIALKKLPGFLNFDMNTELTIAAPEIETVKIISKIAPVLFTNG